VPLAKPLVLLLAAAGLALVVPAGASEPAPAAAEASKDPVVLHFEGRPVHWSEIKEAMAAPATMPLEGRFKFVIDRYVESLALSQYAKEHGLDKRPDVMRKLDEAQRTVLAAAAAQALAPDVTPPEGAVHDYYTMHQDEFVEPARANILYVRLDDAAAARSVAQELRKASSGEGIAPLVAGLASKPHVVELAPARWVDLKTLDPVFRATILKLNAKDRVSKPVPNLAGYYVFVWLESVPEKKLEFSEARISIKKKLTEQMLNSRIADLARPLVKDEVRYSDLVASWYQN
jgi:PPIC-type PPIASE domain